jgi:hypothetical protein
VVGIPDPDLTSVFLVAPDIRYCFLETGGTFRPQCVVNKLASNIFLVKSGQEVQQPNILGFGFEASIDVTLHPGICGGFATRLRL